MSLPEGITISLNFGGELDKTFTMAMVKKKKEKYHVTFAE